LSNNVVAIDTTSDAANHPALAATANGGFAVAYSDITAGTIVVRAYSAASGTSSPFPVYGTSWELVQQESVLDAGLSK
jgi:hypothetical protein